MLLLLDNYAWKVERVSGEMVVLDVQDQQSGVAIRLLMQDDTRRSLRDKLAGLDVANAEDLRKATKGLAGNANRRKR